MLLNIYQARHRAVHAVLHEYNLERANFGLHYLGIYQMKRAFEVFFKYPDGVLVDKALPIIVLVTASKVQLIQSGVSLDILDYFHKI